MINRLENDMFRRKIYDLKGFTIQELLCSFFNKINECIDLSNESFNILEWIKEEGLSNETVKLLNEWLADGTITELINHEKFNSILEECRNAINAYKLIVDAELNNVNKSVDTKFNNYGTEIDNKFTTYQNEINNSLETFNNAISEKLENNQNENQQMINDLKETTNEAIEKVFSIVYVSNTTELELAIEKAVLSPSIIYLHEGVYNLTKTSYIPSNTSLIGLGNVKVQADGLNCYFTNKAIEGALGYTGSNNIHIENIYFDGKGKADGLTMVAFAHAENVSIKNCVFCDLHMWHMVEFNAVKHGVIYGCKFKNYGNVGANGTEAIQLDAMLSQAQFPWFGAYDDTPCQFITIENNIFEDIGKIAIGNHSFKRGVTLKDIFIKNNYFNRVGRAINLNDFNNMCVSENTSADCRTFFHTENKENTSSYLVINGNKHRGYYVNSVEGLGDERFIGINVEGNKGDYRVEFVNITDNHITLCSGHGIGYTADYVTVSNNKFFNIARNGIYHFGGLCGSIYGNCFKDTGKESGRYAILVGNNQNTSSKGVVVNGNTIANLSGICVSNYSEGVIVSNNIGNVVNNVNTNCIVDNNKTI